MGEALTASEKDYCAIAEQYARDVVAGVEVACKWVRLACQRQLKDLARQGSDSFPYVFDRERANRVCRFAELMPHTKGRWGTKLIVLVAWQCFVLTTVYGWVDVEGFRRFRTGYTEVPRKSAKSTLSSIVGLWMVGPDDEPGAEVYAAATTRKQAELVFRDAQRMARRTPGYRQRWNVEVSAEAVSRPDEGSTFKALSADADTLDGLNPHCAIIDEFHAHPTREVFDVLDSATGARRQALIWIITTAGFNRAGVCFEMRTYLCKVLEGQFEDETLFGLIYTVDDGDDPFDPRTWQKANPMWGVSVIEKDMAAMARRAKRSAQSLANFLTKRLNVWVSADKVWMNMQAWDACADESLKVEQFAGEPCVMALDLASKTDVAAKLLLFRREGTYYAFLRGYLPSEAVESEINANAAHYAGWHAEDRLVLTEGSIIDFDVIKADVLTDARRFDVQTIAYDPFQATKLVTELLGERLPMVEFGATVRNFSDPMKELEALVLSGKLRHDGDPVLGWMVSNVVCHHDLKGNIFPRKQTPENKIDGAVGLIMALGIWLREPVTQSVYESRGIAFVSVNG